MSQEAAASSSPDGRPGDPVTATGPETGGSPLRWANWSGRQTSRPRRILAPTDPDGFRTAVASARADGLAVRAVGTSHSHSRVAATDGVLVDTAGWSGLVPPVVDAGPGGGPVATVRSGTTIHDLGPPLHRAGYGLINQGDIDRQSIAGAISTGTHGTGASLRNLSSAIRGLRLVLADGSLVATDPDNEPELFEAGRHSLGGLGLLVEADLAVLPRYRLHERQWTDDPDAVMSDIDRLVSVTRHFEFFWAPKHDRCACKSLSEVPSEVSTDGGGEPDLGDTVPQVEVVSKRERRGWSHQIFPSVRNDLHTEMEYSIPAVDGPGCFAELRTLIHDRFPDLEWPVEYRTVAADDVLLSAARGRATVTISVHQDVRLDDRPLFEASEELFRSYGGRPHWGKVHYLGGSDLAAIHDDYRRWWEVRDRYDPDGVFLTADLERLRP